MSFSNTSRTQYRYALESTQNTIPTVAFQNITAKSGAVESNQTFVTSMGIRTDRTVQDQVLANRVPGGTEVFEMAYGVADPIIAATLQDVVTWNLSTNFAATSLSSSSGSFVLTATAATSANVPPGALLLNSGFSNAVNNGIMLAVSATTSMITVTSSGSTPVTEATSAGHLTKLVGIQGSSVGDIQASTVGLVSNLTNFASLGLVANMVLKVGGVSSTNSFGTAANNDYVRVTAVSSNLISLDNLPSGWTADVGSSANVRIAFGDYIANGTTRNSFTVEEDHPDILFTRDFTGMYSDQVVFKMTPGQILETTITWKGMGITTGTSSATTGAALVAPSNPIMNAVKSIVRINEGGVTAGKMSDGSLTIKNNLGDVPALNVLGNADVRDGQFNCEFDFSMYMSSTQGQSIYSKSLAATQSSLWFVLKDLNNNAYSIDLPAGRFTSATTPVSGINQDYKGTYKFATFYDTVSTKQLIMNRIPTYAI